MASATRPSKKPSRASAFRRPHRPTCRSQSACGSYRAPERRAAHANYNGNSLMFAKSSRILAVLATLPAFSGVAVAAQSQEERNLNEVRNTVVNLLQSLVERGVLTREQAEAMVRSAQEKATKDADAAAAQDAAEAGAVRVPYVPEIVKEEIRKQVTAELAPQIAKEV